MITAIYHFNVKMVTRSKGGCCVASAAYIAGEKIKNERDGKIHDYRNKCELFVPKAERERALALLTSYKKTHSEKGFETGKAINNKPKR